MTAVLTDSTPYHNARTGGEQLERVLQRSDWLIDLAGVLDLVVFGTAASTGNVRRHQTLRFGQNRCEHFGDDEVMKLEVMNQNAVCHGSEQQSTA